MEIHKNNFVNVIVCIFFKCYATLQIKEIKTLTTARSNTGQLN